MPWFLPKEVTFMITSLLRKSDMKKK